MSQIERVAVVGAGTMGNGIAHVFAAHGIPVALVDVRAEALERAMAEIANNLDRQIRKGDLDAGTREEALGRIRTSTDLEEIEPADLIVEAATENRDLKFQIFGRLDEVARPGAVLATNTSSISITEIAAHTDRP